MRRGYHVRASGTPAASSVDRAPHPAHVVRLERGHHVGKRESARPHASTSSASADSSALLERANRAARSFFDFLVVSQDSALPIRGTTSSSAPPGHEPLALAICVNGSST